MPTKSRKGTQVRVSEEIYSEFRKLVRKADSTQTKVLETLIHMATVHDLLNKGWQERLTAALEKGMWHIAQQKHFENAEKCSGLRGADEKWKCIKGRYQKTPLIRFLAEDYDDARELCDGCIVTLEPILKNYELQEKIQLLEGRLETAAGFAIKAPICHKGAVLTANGTEFRSCPKRPSAKTVSIKNFCKKLSNNLPCQLYAEIAIVADRESKVDMNR